MYAQRPHVRAVLYGFAYRRREHANMVLTALASQRQYLMLDNIAGANRNVHDLTALRNSCCLLYQQAAARQYPAGKAMAACSWHTPRSWQKHRVLKSQ